MGTKSNRPAIYCRISRDTEGQALGVERQERECRELAARLGWGTPRTYVDNDTSAFSGARRKAYSTLLDDLKNGVVNGLVVWHPDRLHRRPAELETFIEVVELTGTPIASVTSGDYDLSSAAGRQIARILGAVARGESEHKSERLRSKHQQLRDQGRPNGGVTVFGYQRIAKRYVLDPDAAQLIRDGAASILAGNTVASVAKTWNEAGTGRTWPIGRVSEVMKNPVLAGYRTFRGEIVGQGDWEPILDEATFRRLAAVFARTNRPKSATALLTGLLVCSRCGKNLNAGVGRVGERKYWCKHCGGSSLPLPVADQTVTDAALAILDTTDFANAVQRATGTNQGTTVAAIEEAEAELAELQEAAKAGTIRIGVLLDVGAAIETRIRDLRASIAQPADDPSSLVGQGERLRNAWELMTGDERRTVVRAVIERIEVSQAARRGSHDAATPEGCLRRLTIVPRY